MTQKTALVSTVRGAGSSLRTFVQYHLYLGFDKLYLFLDDPEEAIATAIASQPQVTLTRHDHHLRAKWKTTRFYQQHRFTENTPYLMERQQLNTAVAIQYALREKIGWLLHIDQDELLYAPEFFQSPRQTVGELFQNLTRRQIYHVNFRNYEVLVHPDGYTNPFQEAMLFKRNPHTLPQRKFTQPQRMLIASVPQLPENFFFNYANGKSAAWVSEKLLPDGVHDFHLPEQQGNLAYGQRRLARNRLTRWASARYPLLHRLSHHLLAGQHRHHIYSKNPVILHYYNCSFAEFWRKYNNFRYSSQFKNETTLRRLSNFHVEAPQVAKTGDKEAAEAFYKERVVLADAAVVDQLIQADLVCQITEPANWIEQNVPLIPVTR